MGKTILTPKQLEFLERIQKEQQITKRFYLTGGTALSEFYLHHRVSHDLDFFTEEKEVNAKALDAFLTKISSELSIAHIKRSQFMGLYSYFLVYQDSEKLKVDFNFYPFPRIQKGTMFKNLEIDSVYDIAVNKIHTLFIKPRSRDYLDIYFIMKQFNYSLDKLILDAKAKFDWDIDRITLASQFLRAKEMDESAMLLVPFNKQEMDDWFVRLAKSLEKQVFK